MPILTLAAGSGAATQCRASRSSMALFKSPTKTIDRFQRAALDRAETISYKPRPCEEARAVSLLRDAGASPDCRKGPR